MKAGSVAEVAIKYSGDKVLHKAGAGNFYVEARTSRYPSLNAFTDRALYDLTFRVPKRYTLVSVGNLAKSSVDKDSAITNWVTDVPMAVAGFNYGEFKKLESKDPQTGYQLEVYAATTLPDYLQEVSQGTPMNPASMAKGAMTDATNSARLFDLWFGKVPYRRIAITEQPDFGFGQSWPSLVFLPISAFLDSGARYQLLGSKTFALNPFLDEVTPHEVSHQWWGHIVGWASYRDQWLSEGFADFSAGLFPEFTGKPDEVEKYWERQRKRIIDKNEFGKTANDAGPIAMGDRLFSAKNSGAYSRITYSKGAYVLRMLRMLLWDAETQDKPFMAMMHEFVASPDAANASTESFAAVASRYMRPALDIGGDKTLNWFFSQWVFGTDIPRYRLEYSVAPDASGKFLMTGKLTQSDVSPGFRMLVPIYVENANKQMVRAGLVAVGGNNTATFKMLFSFKPKRVAANSYDEILSLESTSRETP